MCRLCCKTCYRWASRKIKSKRMLASSRAILSRRKLPPPRKQRRKRELVARLHRLHRPPTSRTSARRTQAAVQVPADEALRLRLRHHDGQPRALSNDHRVLALVHLLASRLHHDHASALRLRSPKLASSPTRRRHLRHPAEAEATATLAHRLRLDRRRVSRRKSRMSNQQRRPDSPSRLLSTASASFPGLPQLQLAVPCRPHLHLETPPTAYPP